MTSPNVPSWRITCVHCDDPIPPGMCAICYQNLEDACITCHCEIAHDLIPPPEQITDSVPSNDRDVRDDPGPGWDDAIRIIEDSD